MWLAVAALVATANAAPAAAPTCDVKALTKALVDAVPNQTGKAFQDLAACDPAAANKAAPEAFNKILAGDGGDAAAVSAVAVGAGEAVRGWVNKQEPDDRSRTINKLGTKCDQPGVAPFFLETQKALGEKFWTDRWYRGLDECREASVQELLRSRIATPSSDRTLYFGVVEVFARNLGKNAVPALKASLQSEKDPELASYLVNAFADAAGVGAASGADAEAVKLAIEAIIEVAPVLPAKAVDQGRTTLLALGAEPQSDKLAPIRYKDVMQASGGLLYGVVTTEVATCKKGDKKVAIHTALVNEGGHTWPDQLQDRLKDPVNTAFKLDLGTSCKGTSVIENVTPNAPFKDPAAYQAWVDGALKDIQKKHADVKIKVTAEDPLSL